MSSRVLLNPTAGRGAAAAAREMVEPRVGRENVIVTSSGDHLEHEARQAVKDGLERLVVAGGDGSAHLALQELAGSRTALAVLPLGSGNDMAATFGVPKGRRAALEHALSAPSRPTDLGRVGERRFALYCGFGIDGEISRIYNEKVRWPKGTAGYVRAALEAITSFEAPTVTIDTGDGPRSGRRVLTLAANAPRAGGGMQVAPMAKVDDGRLELIEAEALGRISMLALLAKIFRGGHLSHPKVHHHSVERLEVSSDKPIPVYADGERLFEVGPEPVTVEVSPLALRVVRGA